MSFRHQVRYRASVRRGPKRVVMQQPAQRRKEQPVEIQRVELSPLHYVPIGVLYLVLSGAVLLYLQDWIHACVPAFVVLAGVTSIAWYLMLLGDTGRGPDLYPAAAVVVGWLAYGLFFRNRSGVVPDLVAILAGALVISFVALGYSPMFYRKRYVSKLVSLFSLILMLFTPSDDINVALDIPPLLVLIKATAFYLIYVLSDIEGRLATDRDDYYRSRERRISQSLWTLFTWGQTFTVFFAVIQVAVLAILLVRAVGIRRDEPPLLPVTVPKEAAASDVEQGSYTDDESDYTDEEESDHEEVVAPAPKRRGNPSMRPGGRVGYRVRGRVRTRASRARPRARPNGTMVRGARGRVRRRGAPRSRPRRPVSRTSDHSS